MATVAALDGAARLVDVPDHVLLEHLLLPHLDPWSAHALGSTCGRLRALHLTVRFWEWQFLRRWPATHELVAAVRAEDWARTLVFDGTFRPPEVLRAYYSATTDVPRRLKRLFFDVYAGRHPVRLQVYDRSLHRGFMRSHWDAVARHEPASGAWNCEYWTALATVENITDPARLRAPPAETTHRTPHNVELLWSSGAAFAIGDVVELQWKNTPDLAFGWWWGKVEALHEDGHGLRVLFDQWGLESPWRHIDIKFDLPGPAPNRNASGWIGGLRKLAPPELVALRRAVRAGSERSASAAQLDHLLDFDPHQVGPVAMS